MSPHGRPKRRLQSAQHEGTADSRPVESTAGFSAGWLQQREPFDALARSAAAPQLQLPARLAGRRPPDGAAVKVIDLACGTGSNLRWLAPVIGGHQQWLVVDHDAALLQHWPQALTGWLGAHHPERITLGPGPAPDAVGDFRGPTLQLTGDGFQAGVIRQRLDLARCMAHLPWHAATLVTASALLDLVSADWLQQLVAAATDARVALLMALSVDGRHAWAPSDPDDDAVGALFAAHQQRDKGFGGAALGAAAAPALATALRAAGYRVHTARSDWRLDGRESEEALAMHRSMVDDLSSAALEQAPAAAAQVRAWQRRRQALAARSVLQVGHLDVIALPPE